MRSRNGYTLLEMIVVVALLGLAAALLVPNIAGLSRMETQAAVRRLVSDIGFAQADAMANQSYRRIQFLENGSGYALLRVDESSFAEPFDAGSADYVDDPSGTYSDQGRYVVDFVVDERYDGVTLDGIETDGGADRITFGPLGGTVSAIGMPAGAGRIVVRGADESFEVLVTPMTGKLTVRKIEG